MLERRLVSIYLNDHLAGATGGVELARRTAEANRGTKWGEPLDAVRAEVEADRDSLVAVMERLGVKRNLPKVIGGWSFEKLGRLKLNGQLRGYSPLSRLVELEMLQIGIAGKGSMWQALRHTHAEELKDFDLITLIERAGSQRETVKELHRQAAVTAFQSPSSG